MSMIVTENNEIVSFKNYILNEAVVPKETNYGTDGINKKLLKKGDIVYTFFSKKEKSYLVAIDIESGEVGFSSKDGDITLNNNDYSCSRKDTYNALTVFNNVFYILLEIIQKYNIKIISFDAANPTLGSVYTTLVNSKQFQKTLLDIGFEYVPTTTGYVFKSKN